MTNNFYIYEHWRPDKGLPFYVGKGSDRRAYQAIDGKNQDRCNRRHQFICKHLSDNNLSVEVRIVFNRLDEDSAFSLEKSTISYWKCRGIQLVNVTDGGNGVSMRNLTPEERALITAGISAANKVKWAPEVRKKLSETNKKKWEDPAFREKMSSSLKARWANPEFREKMCAVNQAAWNKDRKKRIEKVRTTRELNRNKNCGD